MALKAAVIMSVISIILLLIYGADVAAAGKEKTGFLPLDAAVRGTVFGGISSIMLIVSFFITRGETSKKLGVLVTIGGALILLGSAVILAIKAGELETRTIGEFGSVLGIGVFIVTLGIIKMRKSSIHR